MFSNISRLDVTRNIATSSSPNVGGYCNGDLFIMVQEQRIEIGLNKRKLRNGFITCTCLGFLGIMLFISTNNTVLKYGAAVISILFLGLGIFYFLRKLIDKKPGILIDDKGILDNSNPGSIGFINWNDVKKIVKSRAMKQELLVLEVSNPEYYMNKETNFLMKKSMAYNYKHFGSPLAISANLLNCDLNELITILEERLLNR